MGTSNSMLTGPTLGRVVLVLCSSVFLALKVSSEEPTNFLTLQTILCSSGWYYATESESPTERLTPVVSLGTPNLISTLVPWFLGGETRVLDPEPHEHKLPR
jgi:hypothetical protein